MSNRWIYEGELEDPYSEFFVASDPSVNSDEVRPEVLINAADVILAMGAQV